jgi:hypothetical protein
LRNIPLTENIHDTSRIAKYAEYMNNSNESSRMDGGKYQSTNVAITVMNDFKATAALQDRVANKFEGETGVTEQNAVRSRQAKRSPRPNNSLELLTNSSEKDKAFLDNINRAGLIKG